MIWPRMRNHLPQGVFVAALFGGVLASPTPAQAPRDHVEVSRTRSSNVIGHTAPHRKAQMATVQEGRLMHVPVREGDFVAQGELLFVIDDAVQRANVDLAAARANSTLEVELARTKWEAADMDREWWVKLRGTDRASSKELNDTISAALVAQLEYQLAEFTNGQESRTLEVQQRLLDQYRVTAPFSGYVAEVVKKPGDTLDRFDPVLTLVQLDPLEVSIDCPIAIAHSVQAGQRFRVRPLDGGWKPRIASVAFASKLADGGSQTFKVKLMVDNADHQWMAGMKVEVDLSNPLIDEHGGDTTPCDDAEGTNITNDMESYSELSPEAE